MSRHFQVKAVLSSWLEHNGRRLDCGPYMSGAIEAKELLAKHNTVPLRELTTGYNGGIFNGPRFARMYVDDSAHGVPFLGSTDILNADLSHLSFLSKKQIADNPNLIVDEGWSLISCSGTIGRMAYARSDMKGMAGSQHFMRVAPDRDKISSGYLYAYLSCRYGIPIIMSGTYGSIIQSIEPQHIEGMPVPRLGKLELKVDELIQLAAHKRVEASKVTCAAIECLKASSGLAELARQEGIPFCASAISSNDLFKRMDGAYHSSLHREVLDAFNNAGIATTTVAKLSQEIVEPKRFKRIEISDAEFGIPMFGTTALMWSDPKHSFLIPRSMQGVEELIVDQKMVLIPRSGQVSGIIGTAVLPYGELIGGAVSEHAIRIKCSTETLAGFVFIALKSEYGRRQLKSRAYGSSIPTLDVHQIGQVVVPDLGGELIEQIGAMGLRSAKLRHEAIEHENAARSLIEHTIQEGGR